MNKAPKAHVVDRALHDEARRITKAAIAAGKLVRQPCERCGAKPEDIEIHAHHEDYTKPLEVMWLCQEHHTERHREIGGYGGARPGAGRKPTTGTGRLLRLSPPLLNRVADLATRGETPQEQIADLCDQVERGRWAQAHRRRE